MSKANVSSGSSFPIDPAKSATGGLPPENQNGNLTSSTSEACSKAGIPGDGIQPVILEPDATPDVVLALNKRHAVIQIGGKTVILNEDYDPASERNVITFSTETHLKLRYKNQRIWVDDPASGKPKLRSIADLWLESPDRKQYAGLEFSPKGGRLGYYNLFRGFPLEAKPGDCQLFLDHIKNVICRGDNIIYDYLLSWMAHAVQKIDEIPEVAIVFRGKQGTGKGVFVNIFGTLFGDHYLTLYGHHQTVGRFNGHLENIILLHLNEALWGGRKEAAGALKGLITDPTTPIEHKGRDIFQVRNYKRVIVSTNELWAVPVDLDDRRFLVLDVSDERKEDHEYFGKIVKQMNNGGLNALMHLLLTRDISEFNVRKMPPTPFSFDIKLKSADPVEQWWFHLLKEGTAESWSMTPEKQAFYRAYLEWCKAIRVSHPEIMEIFSKVLKKLLPELGSTKLTKSDRPTTSRVNCFRLPALGDCRKAFEDLLRAGPDIWK